jgi:hypothetical protein
MMHSVFLFDGLGNQATYTVSDDDFHWSTEYGDSGIAQSFEQAQYRARTLLKERMTAKRRSDEAETAAKYLPKQNVRRHLGYNSY